MSGREIAYRTVEALSGITQKKLWLKDGKAPMTDGNMLTAPLRHPDVVHQVEKLLAHVLFKTNQEVIYQFCTLYGAKIRAICVADGITLSEDVWQGLRTLLVELASVLEVRRVTSLWGRLYAGSHEHITQVKRDTVSAEVGNAHSSVATLAALIEAGVDFPKGKLSPFVPLLTQALLSVEGCGPKATLLVLKGLIVSLISCIVDTAPSQGRSNAMAQLLKQANGQAASVVATYGQVAAQSFSKFDVDQAKKQAVEAMNTP